MQLLCTVLVTLVENSASQVRTTYGAINPLGTGKIFDRMENLKGTRFKHISSPDQNDGRKSRKNDWKGDHYYNLLSSLSPYDLRSLRSRR